MSAALHHVGQSRALPEVTAIEQQRAALADVGAQAVDQRLQMREAAELAEALRGFLEVDASEGIGVGVVRRDAEAVEKGFSNQMRRPPLHLADPDIDARLAEIDRTKLRMRIGEVKDARVAEPL